MLAAALIVFREILEAALVVGIVLAATRGVPGRAAWVGAGLAGGIIGAGLVAAFAGTIAGAAAGMGQELFNAAVMFVAVAMLGWHSIWMGGHGRQMAAELTAVGRAVAAGARPLYAVAVVIAMAVLREGSEAVLFLYGIAVGGNAAGMAGGAVLGTVAGIAAGAAIYAGLLRLATRHLFAVTTWMIILLAAGMAGQGAAFLAQADLLPSLGDALWDTSRVLSDGSILGKALHALVGYTAQPSGIQLLAYALALAIIGVATRQASRHPAAATSPAAAPPS